MAKKQTHEQTVRDNMDKASARAEADYKAATGNGNSAPTDAALDAALPTVEQASASPDSEQPRPQAPAAADRMANARAARNGKPALEESKAARFKRLGQRRVPRAVKAINAVSNLANRSQYEYNIDQASHIIKYLQDAVNVLRQRFTGSKDEAETFSL